MQSNVVRLGRAGGEEDLVRLRAEKTGDGDTRVFERACGLPSMLVRKRRRIAEYVGEVRKHRLDHARIARRRGVVVEVDRRRRHGKMIAPDATLRLPVYVWRCATVI